MKKRKIFLVALALAGGLSGAFFSAPGQALERNQAIERGPKMRPGERPDRRPPNSAEMLKKMDTDNDGGVSADEFKAWGANRPHPGNKADEPEKTFEKIDKNQDGKLSADEMAQDRGRHPLPPPNGTSASPSVSLQP